MSGGRKKRVLGFQKKTAGIFNLFKKSLNFVK
jgi:hypothetical protein